MKSSKLLIKIVTIIITIFLVYKEIAFLMNKIENMY